MDGVDNAKKIMKFTDTGKVRIGSRYQPRLSPEKATAISDPVYPDHTIRNVVLGILFLVLITFGTALLILFLNSDHIYADTKPMYKLLENKDSFTDPCTVIGAPDKSINGYGDQTCKDKKGIPTYTAINQGKK